MVGDGRGRSKEIGVDSTRFTIGSGPDNDLAIDDPKLSRRHAVIENFEGVVQISDCGSEDGTFVNGKRVYGGAILRDNDKVSIGSTCKIVVGIDRSREKSPQAATQDRVEAGARPLDQPRAAKPYFSTPVLALATVAIILIVAVPLVALLNRESKKRQGRATYPAERQNESEKRQPTSQLQPRAEQPPNASGNMASNALTIDQIEKTAVQFMRRISSNGRPYVFPPYAVDALGDITKRVEQYSRSPAIAGALNSIKVTGPGIAAASRREGIEPSLVICVVLTQTDGGQEGDDQVAVSRRVMPELLSLRKTLGTESVDKSLILVAAYKMGGWTKKSHPLLGTMRRLVKNPLTDRNVWYLRERGGLGDEAYDFVVRFIALGIISENPRKFGIAAPPVAF
jgi:pSer/pThr/pTyr-binding forkhead associated (FHA) protein